MKLRFLGLAVAALGAWGMIGCSSAAKSDPVGGLYIEIGSASSTDTPLGQKCTITPHAAQVGVVPPSQLDKGKPVTNDSGGASVSCSVGGGSQIKFSAALSKNNVSFGIQGTVAKGGKGTASIHVYDPTSLTTLQNPADKPCNVYVDSPPLTAGGSKLWARFDCPALVSPSEPVIYCAATTGFMYFDNCD